MKKRISPIILISLLYLTSVQAQFNLYTNYEGIYDDNIFNTSYSDLLGASMPGRWLSGGIEITL